MEHIHDHDHDHDDHYYDDTKLHDNQFIFLNHYLQMIDTCAEGIVYIKKRLELNHTFDLQMFKDCFDAFNAIDSANFLAWNLMKKIDLHAHDTVRSFDQFKPTFEKVLAYQEQENLDKVIETLTTELFPQYTEWAEKVNKVITPHIRQ